MIYILAGNDNKKKGARLKTIIGSKNVTPLSSFDNIDDSLRNYASSTSLFGDSPVIVIDNALSDIATDLLKQIQGSSTIFIFLEDKILASSEKKYQKYATIEKFEEKKLIKPEKFNTFVISDAFARHDKVGAWIFYREAIDAGIEPESISGILFWKIKTMLLTGSKSFSSDELKKQSGELVSLYHKSHRGESDFVIGLEQFILSSLSR